MISLRQANVTRVLSRRKGITTVEVALKHGAALALNYDDLTGPVEAGDPVILNTTAVELGLGTGGYHYILWNLHRQAIESQTAGHIMKLRYTPLQISCLSVEEPDSPHHEAMEECCDLGGMPVVVGSLHSQLAAAAVAIKDTAPDLRLAYIMTDGAALPIAFSKVVQQLTDLSILDGTITSGHAFGGDYEAVNVYSAMIAAKQILKADICIVIMGPGIVGTGTALGFSGIEQGQILNAAGSLNGNPIAMVRLHFGDERTRHYGVSHHTLTTLSLAALYKSNVVLPDLDENKKQTVLDQLAGHGIPDRHQIVEVEEDITLQALRKFKLNPTTMGRNMDAEPDFFRAAGAAGLHAAQTLRRKSNG